MKWVKICMSPFGEQIYGRIDDDNLMRVTCSADHPEFVAWLAEGHTPEPWEAPVAD